jgi:hypothetical protein
MTEILGVVRAQLDALLELLDKARRAYCERTLREARDQAGGYLKRARRVARERVHRAVGDERDRLERELRLAAAGIETEQRHLGRQRDLELIRAGWVALEEALQDRWADPQARREWAQAAIEEAGELLLGKDWTIEHPEDWPDEESSAAAATATEMFAVEAAFKASSEVPAGLRIRNGGSLVDMSPAGLLAHRRSIEADLLAEVQDTARGGQGGRHG